MKSAKDPRHIGRILGVMDLYRFYFPSESKTDELDLEDLELGNYAKNIRSAIVVGVKDHSAEIDDLINMYSVPLKSVDLDTLVLQIVRSAVYEGFIAKTIPAKVAVDEAIEICRDFGLELSARKVGGILGKIFEAKSKETPEEINSTDSSPENAK